MSRFVKYFTSNLSEILGISLFLSTLFLTGYTYNQKVTINSVDTLDLNPFVEPGFPFISTSLDARKIGRAFPDDNIASRALAINLGDSAYVCFDTDLLRWSVAWTGKFLPMVLMAQISYKDFFNKNNKVTTLTGNPKLATGLYAGWSKGEPVFEDIRPDPELKNQPKWGPIPADKGRWKGMYLHGEKVILNYSVGQTDIFEMPGKVQFGNETAFIRTFQINHRTEPLSLIAAEVRNADYSEVKGNIAYIYHGSKRDTVTALGIVRSRENSMQPRIKNNRYLSVFLPSTKNGGEVSILVWKGPSSKKAAFEKLCKKKQPPLPDFGRGGPAYWHEEVLTAGKLSPDTAAYVTDQLTLPLPNPWKRNVRIADIAFFEDGRAAAVTFEGDVWILDGIDSNLHNIRWKRFASGLHEPMSVEVVKGNVYIFGREGIVRLQDLNRDGVADHYENFSNVMIQSPESREWAADMVYAPDGSFYVAKGGSQSNGPGVTSQVAKGFRAGSDHNGTILKISPDGLAFEVIATGLRGPYLGIHPENGTLTASDQQGNFVPSTPIFLIKKGDYYGVPPTTHRKDNPSIAPPLTWIPHRVDRSSISQAWITGDKMGPINGDLIHFSFARPGLFRVLIDSSASIRQGGVSFINANYPAPTSKGAISPIDGQLYITGFNLWGSSSTGVSALQRLRYTGKTSYMPNHFKVTKQGVILGFDSPLDASSVTTKNFEVKRWNYKRTQEYGSGHFKLDGTSGEEVLQVLATHVSADGKSVLLLLPDMQEVMQMEVAYNLRAKDGKSVNQQFWFTVNKTSEFKPESERFDKVDLSILTAKNPLPGLQTSNNELASAAKGKEIFQQMACSGCHSEGTKTKGMYGPPFQNLYGSTRYFEDGSSAIADDKYVRESILKPGAKIIKGYNEEMPSFVGILTESDIESITLYIKSLSKK